MLTALLILILLLAIFGLPLWPYSAAWGIGYWPSGLLVLLFIVILIVALNNGAWRRGPMV